jgi:prepilin-type N-terminal cleavage/methylation domain-containing protein
MSKQNGLTLIELLIVIAIFSIITVIVSSNVTGTDTEKVKNEMLTYAQTLRPDLNEWTLPYCVDRDTDSDGYLSCSISGKDKSGTFQQLNALCAGGTFSWGNSGCKVAIARIIQ